MAESPRSRGRILLGIALLFLTFVSVGAGYLFATQTGPDRTLPDLSKIFKRDKPVESAERKGVPCPIDGEDTSREAAARRPVGVIVENSPAARPQSGLAEAEFVMEALAEGGITRFLAVFLHNQPQEVGPVRSARPYFVEAARGFDALFGHVGGSKEAMSYIRKRDVADVDQFFNPGAYRRAKDRRGPHNVYTGISELRRAAGVRKYAEIGSFEGYEHKDDLTAEERPARAKVTIDISFPAFRVDYEYDRATNRYRRFVGGVPHRDMTAGKKLEPKVVAVAYARTVSRTGGTLDVGLIGDGPARIFQDGTVVAGSWEKPSLESKISFYDQSGGEIIFNRGQIWLHVVRPGTSVVSK